MKLVVCGVLRLRSCSPQPAVRAPAATGAYPVRAPRGLHAFVLSRRRGDPRSSLPAHARRSRGTPVRAARRHLRASSSRPARSFDDVVDRSSTYATLTDARSLAIAASAAVDDRQARTRSGRTCAGSRANGQDVTPWSKPFGFNMRLDSDDARSRSRRRGADPLDADRRRDALRGARTLTFVRRVSFQTTDERRRRARVLHVPHRRSAADDPLARPRRFATSTTRISLTNGLPRVSLRPVEPRRSRRSTRRGRVGVAQADRHASRTRGTRRGQAERARAHAGLRVEAGSAGMRGRARVGGSSLYRVYIFTDNHCVNQCLRPGSIVGSPGVRRRARSAARSRCRSDGRALAADRGRARRTSSRRAREGNAFDAAGAQVVPQRDAAGASSVSRDGSARTRAASAAARPASGRGAVGRVGRLPDIGWPTGRYYWTVVPVERCDADRAVDPRHDERPAARVPRHASCRRTSAQAGHGMSFGMRARSRSSTPAQHAVRLRPRRRAGAWSQPRRRCRRSTTAARRVGAGASARRRTRSQLSRRSYPWKARESSRRRSSLDRPAARQRRTSARGGTACAASTRPADGAQAMTLVDARCAIQITGDRFASSAK